MTDKLRIVGQGLAGSLFAWHALRRGLEVEIVDRGHERSASRIAAGIINPITGQRLVKSWRIDEFLPVAVAAYTALEADLGMPLLHRYRLRRLFRDSRERRIAEEKWERNELQPFVSGIDHAGLWIEHAFRIDSAVVIQALRMRWQAEGRLRRGEPEDFGQKFDGMTVWCRGAGELLSPRFASAGLHLAKGEIISIKTSPIDAHVIMNDGQWLLPVSADCAKVGATFETDFDSEDISRAALAKLEVAAQRLVGNGDFQTTGQDSGVRVTTPDKHPVGGRHPVERNQGILNGLGSKGALLAPYLAQQWCDHLLHGAPFDAGIDVVRFFAKTVRSEDL